MRGSAALRSSVPAGEVSVLSGWGEAIGALIPARSAPSPAAAFCVPCCGASGAAVWTRFVGWSPLLQPVGQTSVQEESVRLPTSAGSAGGSPGAPGPDPAPAATRGPVGRSCAWPAASSLARCVRGSTSLETRVQLGSCGVAMGGFRRGAGPVASAALPAGRVSSSCARCSVSSHVSTASSFP